MNPVERVVRRLDKTQQRLSPLGFVVGVVKKYGDDNGGVLAGNFTYCCFMSLFPLLLVLTTVLGLVAAADEGIRDAVLDAVAAQVPLIGRTLEENVQQLRRDSVIGLVVGLIWLIWGATGLAQAGLHTMAQVWNVPGPDRPGYFQRLGRSGIFFGMLGAGVVGTTLLTSLTTYGQNAPVLVVLAEVGAGLLNIGLFTAAYRILTPKKIATRKLIPGAATGGVLYTTLQFLGTYLVHRFLHTNSVYGVFAVVLGLLAWIFLAVQITIYSAEINVVLARRLWPRSIVQPPLTVADRASLALQVLQSQRRTDEQVEVTFSDTGGDTEKEPRGGVS